MKNLIYLLLLSVTLISCSEQKPVKFITLTSNSEDAKNAFMEGVLRDDQNEVNESKVAFKKATELDNDFLIAKVFYNSGIPSVQRENLIYAYENREKVSDIEKKIIEANYQMQIYGEYNKAIEIFDSLIFQYPDIPFLYERTANMKAFNKNFDQAISYWKKALELNPNSYFSALRLGLLNVTVGTEFMPLPEDKRDLEEGKKWLKLASEIRPNASATPRFLGNIYRAELELDKALAAYKLALTKNTEKTSQLMEQNLMVAHTLNAMGKYESAREAYSETIKLSVDNYWWAINHNYYAMSLLAEKKYDEAIRFLSQAQIDLMKIDDSKEVLEWGYSRIEFLKWLIISHSQRKEESMAAMNILNEKSKNDLDLSLNTALDKKEIEKLERNYAMTVLFRQAWSDILFGEYDSARTSLDKMYAVQKTRVDENLDALNQYHALSGYLNLMEGNIGESLSMYEKRLERGDMGEYHNYFYALTLKASGNQEKSKEIFVNLANSPFVDWTIALVKNLAKDQIKTNL